MAQIKYSELAAFLKGQPQSDLPRVSLIYGENYLVKESLTGLYDIMLGEEKNSFSVETLEGASTSMGDLIEQVTTMSFFSPKKIVIVKQAPLFTAGTKQPGQISYTAGELDHLASIIESGLPENHFLVLTTTTVDRRKKIFKAINDKGCIIDCTVAQGNRKADLDEQHKVLHSVAMQVLSRTNKTIDRGTFIQLADLTGFNLDLLVRNLEKLIAFTGNRPDIVPDDVKAVIKRDKKDPIFNLTNAFLDKNLTQSLFYLNSLLIEGYHPLQILKSIENQVRKLLMVKSFLQTVSAASPVRIKSMNFNTFKQALMPQITQYDLKLKTIAEESNFKLSGDSGKKKETIDILIAPNPKNAYPVYQTFLKSERFSLTELQDLMIYLSDLDLRLKTSTTDINTAIEHLLINACSKGGFAYAAENKDRRHHF